RLFTNLTVFLLFICTYLNDLSAQGVYQLWGTTWLGGTSDNGTIFSLDGSGNHFKSRYSFSVQNEGFDQDFNSLAECNGKLYGTTIRGGTGPLMYAEGVFFEWDPVSNVYTKIMDLKEGHR